MSREFAKAFYNSKAWKSVRAVALERDNYICCRCSQPATQVHHKQWLKPSNINDSSITLDLNNLESLCDKCHQHEHNIESRSYAFDSEGNIIYAEKKLKPIWRT